jgi:hypothetical protein
MSFPWWTPARNTQFGAKVPALQHQMHVSDLHTRASLLLRLGRSRDEVVATLRAYVRWDFSRLDAPKVEAEIESIVDGIVARAKGVTR